jgi:hypothetical protein
MTQLIRQRGSVVAVAGPARYYLAPEVEARPRGDAQRRTVALMCAYAHAVHTGRVPGPYSDARAERYARHVLEQLAAD